MLPKIWQSGAKALVEDFALVEADFQQYYQLNLEEMYAIMRETGAGFLRYARLFANLPVESRTISNTNKAATWSWHDETLSSILFEIRRLNATYYNTHTEKTAKKETIQPQERPGYVQEAIDEYREFEKEQKRSRDEIDVVMKDFWQSREPNIKFS